MTDQLLLARTPDVRCLAAGDELAAIGSASLGCTEAVCCSGLRSVEFEWLGARDPGLWNWLRVTAPVDPTAAEVALALWHNPLLANRLTMAGPYVGIAPEQACRLAGARAHRPELFAPAASLGEQLASSCIADEVALSQAEHAKHRGSAHVLRRTLSAISDRACLLDALGSTSHALDDLYRELEPWMLHLTLVPAMVFVRDKQWRLRHASPAERDSWALVVAWQHDIVREAAAGTRKVLALLAHAGLSPEPLQLGDREQAAPHVLQTYAQAAGTSQLVVTAQGALTRAAMARAMLEAAIRSRSAVEAVPAREPRSLEAHAPAVEPDAVGCCSPGPRSQRGPT